MGIHCERNVCEEGWSKATGREKREQGLSVREIKKIVPEIILRKYSKETLQKIRSAVSVWEIKYIVRRIQSKKGIRKTDDTRV